MRRELPGTAFARAALPYAAFVLVVAYAARERWSHGEGEQATSAARVPSGAAAAPAFEASEAVGPVDEPRSDATTPDEPGDAPPQGSRATSE